MLPSGTVAPQFVQNDPEGFWVAAFFSVDGGLAVRRLEAASMIAAATAIMSTITIMGSV